jgi:hypothetical protein
MPHIEDITPPEGDFQPTLIDIPEAADPALEEDAAAGPASRERPEIAAAADPDPRPPEQALTEPRPATSFLVTAATRPDTAPSPTPHSAKDVAPQEKIESPDSAAPSASTPQEQAPDAIRWRRRRDQPQAAPQDTAPSSAEGKPEPADDDAPPATDQKAEPPDGPPENPENAETDPDDPADVVVISVHPTRWSGEATARRIAEMDAEVVAIHDPYYMYEPPEINQRREDALTSYVSIDGLESHLATLPLPEQKGAAALTDKFTQDKFHGPLLEGMRGTGRRIVLLDIPPDHPDYPSLQEHAAISEAYRSHVDELADNDTLRQDAAAALKSAAESAIMQNEAMAQRLAGLAREFPGTTICAVVSDMHKDVHDVLTNQGFESRETFINSMGKVRDVYYDSYTSLVREIMSNPNLELTTGLLNRVIMQDMIMNFEEAFPPSERYELTTKALVNVERMNDQRLAAVLDHFDAMKAAGRTNAKRTMLRMLITEGE